MNFVLYVFSVSRTSRVYNKVLTRTRGWRAFGTFTAVRPYYNVRQSPAFVMTSHTSFNLIFIIVLIPLVVVMKNRCTRVFERRKNRQDSWRLKIGFLSWNTYCTVNTFLDCKTSMVGITVWKKLQNHDGYTISNYKLCNV